MWTDRVRVKAFGASSCRICGDAGQQGVFCTNCGAQRAAAASITEAPAVRLGRSGRRWLIGGLVAILAVSGTAGGVLMAQRSGPEETTATPSPIAAEVTVPSSVAADSTSESSVVRSEAAPAVAQSPLPVNPTVIVLDASGSMKTDDAPGPRIEAAKDAVRTLVDGLPTGAPVALIAYGTATDSSDAAKSAGCQDIKTLVPLGPVDKQVFDSAVDGVVASGYTPLGNAARAAAALLPASGHRTIVIVSDGEDTCAPPAPCDVAKELSGPGLTIHSVGFRVSGDAKDQLTCMSQAAGGRYVDASNALQLEAFLRTTVDPNAAVNTLTHVGFSDVAIGMSIAEAKAVDPTIDPAPTGTVVIVWRDCDLTFRDGLLMAIRPHQPVPTQDGLAVADDVGKAGQLYGSSVVQSEGGRTHAIFPVQQDSDLGYDVTFTPTAPGALAGPITAIVLCRCKPATAQSLSTVDPGDYLKTPGRWWFRTPDDAWNCSMTQNSSGTGQVFCESAHYLQNDKVTYPQMTLVDEQRLDCGEIGPVAGSVRVNSEKAGYGQCGHGDASEFSYDKDKGVPGLGRILADGQVLVAAGYRCFISGFAVTCGPDPASGIGFTIDQDDYRIYPRDGAIPAPGGTSSLTGSGVIGPDGFGTLRLGMTLDQAHQADPALVVDRRGQCVLASSPDTEQVVFNPDGRLAWIRPRGNVRTPEGLAVGDTADKAFTLYLPDEPQTVRPNDGENRFPVAPNSGTEYVLRVVGLSSSEFSADTPASQATIDSIALDGGQRCFG